MTHEYKLYANSECVETVTFDDESGTFMTDNPQSKIIDIHSTRMNQQAKKSEIKLSQNGSQKNCPNCGAPITGDSCEYCGTIFVDRKASEIEKANRLYSDVIDRLSMYELNQQACDLRSAILQATTSAQIASQSCQLQYGLQGMCWGDTMAQQASAHEIEQWEKRNLLASINAYPYHDSTGSERKKKRTIIEFLKGL